MESRSRQSWKHSTNSVRAAVLKWRMRNAPAYNQNTTGQRQREDVANAVLSRGGQPLTAFTLPHPWQDTVFHVPTVSPPQSLKL